MVIQGSFHALCMLGIKEKKLWLQKEPGTGQRHPKKFAYGLYLSDLLPYFHEKASYRPYLR